MSVFLDESLLRYHLTHFEVASVKIDENSVNTLIIGKDVCWQSPDLLEYELLDDGTYSVKAKDKTIEGDIYIPSEYNGTPVSTVAYNGFTDCEGITGVVIADGVTVIEDYAFCYCKRLEHITLPDSIRKIGTLAFIGTKYWGTEENWSDGVLYIGNHLIGGSHTFNKTLDVVIVRKGTIGIADGAFSNNKYAKTIELNEDLIYIGERAFSGCAELEGITVPDSVTSIGRSAFSQCSKLTTVTIGARITTLAEWAFSDCTNLYSVVVRGFIHKVEQYAFNNCTNLSIVYSVMPKHEWTMGGIGRGNEALTNATFYVYSKTRPETQGYYWHYVNGKVTLWAHSGCEGNYSVSTIHATCEEGGYTVHTCSACGDSYVTDEIPALGHDWSAWLDDIPPSCQKGRKRQTCFRCGITMYMFIPATGEHSFRKSVIEAPTCTTDGYTKHTCRVCGESYETTEKALGHTWSLWKHILVEGTPYAPRKRTCSVCGEEEIRIADFILSELSDGTYSIKAFDITTTPSEIIIPSSFNGKAITKIESYAFAGCKTITEVAIPYSITDIDSFAFYECTNLTTVTFPNGFVNGVEVGSNLISIGDFAFGKCENLTNITIPDGCTTIRQFAFSGCTKLNVIVIPPTLSNMGNGVFHLSDDLTVRVEQEKRPEGWDENWCDSNTNIEWTEADENTEPCTHTWLDWYVSVEPICEWTGTVRRVCSTCGKVEEKEIDSLGHDWDTEVVVVPPTCEEQGYTIYTCNVCGETGYGDYVPALGHDYVDSIVEPDCDDGGYTLHTCKRCGHKYYDNYTDPTGLHNWGDWTIDLEPTCTSEGSKTCTCKDCGTLESASIPMTPHIEGDWIIDKQPTTEEEGSMHQECTVCGYKFPTISIPKLEDTDKYILTESGDFLTDEEGNKLIIEGE